MEKRGDREGFLGRFVSTNIIMLFLHCFCGAGSKRRPSFYVFGATKTKPKGRNIKDLEVSRRNVTLSVFGGDLEDKVFSHSLLCHHIQRLVVF